MSLTGISELSWVSSQSERIGAVLHRSPVGPGIGGDRGLTLCTGAGRRVAPSDRTVTTARERRRWGNGRGEGSSGAGPVAPDPG